MLIVTLESTTGTASITCFPRTASEYGKKLLMNAIVVVRGKASHRERFGKAAAAAGEEEEKNAQVEVIAEKVETVVENAMAADARPRSVHIRIDGATRNMLRMLRDTLANKEGGSPLYLRIDTADGEVRIKSPLLVDPDDAMIEQVRRMLGGGAKRAWVE